MKAHRKSSEKCRMRAVYESSESDSVDEESPTYSWLP